MEKSTLPSTDVISKTGFLAIPVEDKIEFASKIATQLSKVIDDNNLYMTIKERKYIKVDGWAALGNMLHVLPKEEYIKELEDGSYEASVSLIDVQTGNIVGGASAICGIDEKHWKNANKFARRSMAVTRATGKAFRLGFAWIPALKGYATTPYEEMPEEITIDVSNDYINELIALTAQIADDEIREKAIKSIRANENDPDYLKKIETRIRAIVNG